MRSCRLAVVGVLGVLFVAPAARPCSRVLWNENGRSVLVGRNMDWFEDIKSNIYALQRGMKREGLAPKNPLTWTSKYGSVVVTGYESVSTDGVNEKGLACHLLYLPETKTGPRDEKVPGLTISLWTQFYLDNFATVAEAVKALASQPYQLLMAVEPTSKKAGTVHIALDDPTGDSAILECVDGKIVVYHDRKHSS
jgi:penicillin V acylase-like amidase (Ntn superfamily)